MKLNEELVNILNRNCKELFNSSFKQIYLNNIKSLTITVDELKFISNPNLLPNLEEILVCLWLDDNEFVSLPIPRSTDERNKTIAKLTDAVYKQKIVSILT
jgi:hypothetical protein